MIKNNSVEQFGISLKQYNTFSIDIKAKRLVRIHNEEKLVEFIDSNEEELFILGGGSNILFTKDVDKTILKNELKGINILEKDESTVKVEVGSGENWHELVLWTLKNDFGGIENLSLIPGTVGAAPIQNIGAYGVELKDVFIALEAIHIKTGERKRFSKEDCKFGYRESIFKKSFKGQYFIIKVILELTCSKHQLHTSYGPILKTLEEESIDVPTIQDISQAVIKIRSSKLPDPQKIGNAGSFFKNPEIPIAQFQDFIKKYPEAPHYIINEQKVKIPAGWLIQECGWKGKREGDAGCHKFQALVLVNYGKAKGKEILNLAKRIQKSVFNKFGIEIVPEVNIFY